MTQKQQKADPLVLGDYKLIKKPERTLQRHERSDAHDQLFHPLYSASKKAKEEAGVETKIQVAKAEEVKVEDMGEAPAPVAFRLTTTPVPSSAGRRGNGAESSSSNARREPASTRDSGDMDKLVTMTAQLALSAARQAAVATAASTDTMLIDKSNPIMVKIKEVTTKFFNEMKSCEPKDRPHMPPVHVLMWMELVTQVQMAEGCQKADLVAIQSYIESRKNADPKEVGRCVMVFKVGRTYKADKIKVTMATRHSTPEDEVWKVIQRMLVTMHAAQPKLGIAPRSNAERVVGELLGRMSS
eukprot:TRINITY_DN111229_c0_g1_i1.p3 TRINITY_DN111229_c0_g1~~TRINITY_DN111229_c0_g1_i1.p3  ORF type:complete len:299 (+),score=70.74 TRINITY_DN111229_c0_g1_i1:39-935(+)